jgi:archaellum biogenesis protein FlaJ (TadC family)
MARKSGRVLMMAGLIVAFVGLCIVLVRLLRVPEYWVPLMVGVGLFLLGLVRWLTSRDV